jgi:hypothetical protein
LKQDLPGVWAVWLGWFALALWVLPNGGHFLLDEAVFFHQAISASRGHWFPTLGPMISGTQPLAFTPGGAFSLILAPFFWISPDPRAGVIGLMALSVLGGLIWDRVFVILGFREPKVRILAAFALAFLPWHARLTDRIWNVHLFPFLTPLFFWCGLRWIAQPSSRSRALILGVVLATALQIHLGAVALAVVALGFLDTSPRRRAFLKALPWLALGGVLTYLPYALEELSNGGQNTARMMTAHPASPGWDDLLQAFLAPARFNTSLRISWDHEKLRWTAMTLQDGLLLAAGAILAGVPALRKTAWRTPMLLSLAWLPAFFLLTQRPFYPHYVAALAPFWMAASAVGVASGIQAMGNPAKRRASMGVWLFLLVLGLSEWQSHYGRRARRVELIPTIPVILEQSRLQATKTGSPEAPVLPLLTQNPAISLLQVVLLQWVDGKPVGILDPSASQGICELALPLPGRGAVPRGPVPVSAVRTPLFYESELICPR